MNKPLISVVMVIRNVERFLAEAIKSVLCQTFKDFEFIIVDFGSTDKSKAIAASYAATDSRIMLHEIPTCSLTEARNAACLLAQGQYIAIMDSDDISAPDRLASELDFMEKHAEVGLMGGATEWIDAAGRSLRIDRPPAEDHEIRAELAVRCPFCQSTALIRKEAFTVAGGYRPVFAQAEDYDLWLRIADHFKVANLRQVVLKYRIHPHQLTLRKRMQQTLCVLAAQISASSRRNGNPDPLSSIEEITTAVLASAGVTEATQQITAASDYLIWIRTMCQAGEYASALDAAFHVLGSSEWKYLERWQIADLYLAIAGIYWREKKHVKSLLAAGRAVAARPKVIGRPLKPLLQRLGMA
jgi:hypothetical protein